MKRIFLSLLLLFSMVPARAETIDTNLFQSLWGYRTDIYSNPFTSTPPGQPINGSTLTNVSASYFAGNPPSVFLTNGQGGAVTFQPIAGGAGGTYWADSLGDANSYTYFQEDSGNFLMVSDFGVGIGNYSQSSYNLANQLQLEPNTWANCWAGFKDYSGTEYDLFTASGGNLSIGGGMFFNWPIIASSFNGGFNGATNAAPANTTTPKLWMNYTNSLNGQTYKIPLYQ